MNPKTVPVPPNLKPFRRAFWLVVVTLVLGLALVLYGRWWTGAHLTYEQQRLSLRLLLVAYAGLVGGVLGCLLGDCREGKLATLAAL